MKRKGYKFLTSVFLFFVISLCLYFCSFGATDSFEKSISAFPESYKPALRELHKSYPKWVFQPVETGLDWYAAVNAENSAPSLKGTKSAIHNNASNLLKDKSSGFYNSSTGAYSIVDAGFVRADKSAVAYYMDPRNFLNVYDIFQFELLSFSDVITVSDVDLVLKGTFMYQAKINYYNSSGSLKKTDETYAQCIYNAGKKYNINPCFLASRIRGEVVSGGGVASGSVTGKYSGYEGYYNFYNIGAYADATAPIANGLKYASQSGSYGRPWNTPSKAINGGAQFLAESYIAKGQNTGYSQKFNVHPVDKSKTYEHQYMSNIVAPVSQSYTTYSSYSSDNLMSIARTFAIPVFNNMPGSSEQMSDFVLFDSYNQTAVPTATLNVRTEPNTGGSVVVSVRTDTKVTVLSKCRNSSWKYSQQLYYPYWYYISFVQDNKSYKGYAVADYLNLTTALNVNKGKTFNLPAGVKGSEKPVIYTSDSSVVSVDSSYNLKTLKNGTAYITATTSNKGYDYIKVNVGSFNNSSLSVSGFSVTPSSSGAQFSWKKNSSASGYELTVFSGDKVIFAKRYDSSITSASVSSLSMNSEYSAKIRAYSQSSSSRIDGEYAVISDFIVAPKKVTGLSCIDVSLNSFTLKWDSISGVSGYEISKKNGSTGAYDIIKTVTENKYIFSDLEKGISNQYKVRAFINSGGKKYYGDYSTAVEGYTYMSEMTVPGDISVKTDKITMKWTSVNNANKYLIYLFDSSVGKYVKHGETTSQSYLIDSLTAGRTYKIMLEAVNANSSNERKICSCSFEVSTLPEKVSGINEISSTGYKASVKWNACEGAVKYQIDIYDTVNDNYKLYKETANTSLTISGLNPDQSYKIRIRSAVKNIKGFDYGEYSSAVNIYTGPKKVKNIAVTGLTYNTVSLKWSAVSNAAGYYVYCKESSADTSKLVATVTDRFCKIGSLKADTQYSFTVKPYRIVNSKKISGSVSDAYKVKTAPTSVSGLKSDGHTKESYTLYWNAVPSADGYHIFRYDSSSKKYVKVASTTKTKYTFKGLNYAKTDKYKVAAYIKVGSKKYDGKLSSAYSTCTLPKNPTSLTYVKNADGSVTLTWKKAARVTGYRVLILNSKTGSKKSLGFTSDNTFTVSSSKFSADKKSVIIRSYIKIGSTKYYSSGTTKSIK